MSEFDDGLSSEIAAAMSAGNVDYATAKAIVHGLAAWRKRLLVTDADLEDYPGIRRTT